jgi:hypothetical protein
LKFSQENIFPTHPSTCFYNKNSLRNQTKYDATTVKNPGKLSLCQFFKKIREGWVGKSLFLQQVTWYEQYKSLI